jgi:hypothetical protein
MMARLESGYRSAEELRHLKILFPVGAPRFVGLLPTACAVGCILTPLRGCYLSARKLLGVLQLGHHLSYCGDVVEI